MSRIGKKPISVPEKVEMKLEGSKVSVKGPKGSISFTFSNEVQIEKEGSQIKVSCKGNTLKERSLWGLSRTLLNNMVLGVTQGFVKNLTFTGVGYKVAVNGKNLVLNLGYSHPIEYGLPEGISVKITGNNIEVSGVDKELVGFVAAKIRSFRPPEPYKGKGVKYINETIIRKAGKTGAKK